MEFVDEDKNDVKLFEVEQFVPSDDFLSSIEVLENLDVLVEEENWDIIERGPQGK